MNIPSVFPSTPKQFRIPGFKRAYSLSLLFTSAIGLSGYTQSAEPAKPADKGAAVAPAVVAPAAVAPAATAPEDVAKFKHQDVIAEAAKLAKETHLPPALVAPALLDLDYDLHRQIRFKKEAALWHGTQSKFEAEFFAPGSYFTSGVDIFSIENGQVTPITINENTFDTPRPDITELLVDTGKLAGFRLHYPLNKTEYKDELVVFLGASYFRAISKGQVYGLSARGLALDVAEATGEEFPSFRKFWIERPSNNSKSIQVHALLESKSVVGAYRFSIYPGSPTYMDVYATLFPRTTLKHVGLAPLTSMFYYGPIDGPDSQDYRPAVHDSEGLAMLSGRGEAIWRPLTNPKKLQISAFQDEHPKGFGLIQRQRNFSAYQDLEAHYHQRPSAWVTPLSDWGRGHVVLVEIPSDKETNDNIVAYWRPEIPMTPEAGPYVTEYRVSWPGDTKKEPEMSRVIRSASSLDFEKKYHQVALDYDDTSGVDASDVTLNTYLSQGKLINAIIHDNPETGGWRVFLTFDPQGKPFSEIRIVPTANGKQVGETWLHRWLPQ